MIIKRLVLHNFGVYAGTNTFEFHASKPIVLIGGLNGRGKTTFLEAVLLALYGRNSFAYLENEDQSYGQYLRSYVNISDETNESYVELSFFMNADKSEEYRIRREWNSKTARTLEKVSVYKEEVYNQFLTDNWSMFMENVLPSALSSFFFFDGEKIATLAGENTSEQMKQSIKALLGITVLDHLENDLVRVISRTAKNSVNKSETEELEVLRKKKEETAEILAKTDSKIELLISSISDIQRKLDKANEVYIAKGGDIVSQRQELIEKRAALRIQLSTINEELLAAAASELPLLMVKDLLWNVREQAEIEQNNKTIAHAVKRLIKELPLYISERGVEPSKRGDIEDFLSYFELRTGNKTEESVFDLSDSSLGQLQMLLDDRLRGKKFSTTDIKDKLLSVQKELDQIESYLSVDIDEKAIAALYKKIVKLEQEKSTTEAQLEIEQEKRKTLNYEAGIAASEFNKKVESYLRRVELNDDGERIIKYANVANAIIAKYRLALQKSKVEEVAVTMTNCYKLLASKKSLIERIDMDPVSLDMVYINSKGEAVPRKSLSAGEKQMMVIALLWSLAICSKKRLPVIIDTPLSRLDSIHRQALINVYFPKASDQTIILSTDSEIDETYYHMMKNDIGDEFTLVYDEESKSTSIKSGYFMGE